MNILKLGFSVFALSAFFISCKTGISTSAVQSITYTNTYGRGGMTSITVNKDSVITTSSGFRSEGFPEVKRKIAPKEWSLITSKLNVSQLEHTKNGGKRGVFDGNDEIFRINTSDKQYKIINASADTENYKQLELLKTNLLNLLPKK